METKDQALTESDLLFRPAVAAAAKDPARFEVASLTSTALAVMFLGTGVAKLVAADFVIATFAGSDFPLWTLTAIGLIEITAAILVMLPTTRLLGSATIAGVMLGAMGYHVLNGEFLMLGLPFLALAVAAATFGLEFSLRKRSFLES